MEEEGGDNAVIGTPPAGHMHVCPAVAAFLAGWKSNGLGRAMFSLFP